MISVFSIMANSHCPHDYLAFPLPDKTILIECLDCKHSYQPIHGQDEPIIELTLQVLDQTFDKYNELLKDNPENYFFLTDKIPPLLEQIKILERWLNDANDQLLLQSEQETENSEPLPDISEQETENSDPTQNGQESDRKNSFATEIIDSPTDKPTKFKQLDLVEELAKLNKKRRSKGEGSGEIIYRTSKPKSGKSYEQMFFKISVWCGGNRTRVKSFYIPKRLEDWVKQAQSSRMPVKDILAKIKPNYSPDF